ncbi:phage virion morphogenesis protein [Mycolicibacterium sp. PDY-3]|uniref:phage virion morphogenesis protein n=1 Tax=Mycolicibacterium sp. PDY-3 TaxID=3376069 RepID=UPI003797C4A4
MADALELELDVKGAKEVTAMLRNVGADVSDLKGAMADVGDHARKYFGGQVFASRGGVLGQPWRRLSPNYAAQKAKRYPGRPVLVRSGLMQRSFRSTPSAMSVTISNDAPWFKYHQSSAARRRRIPRRVMIGVYNGMQDDVTKIIASALAKKIKRSAG